MIVMITKLPFDLKKKKIVVPDNNLHCMNMHYELLMATDLTLICTFAHL